MYLQFPRATHYEDLKPLMYATIFWHPLNSYIRYDDDRVLHHDKRNFEAKNAEIWILYSPIFSNEHSHNSDFKTLCNHDSVLTILYEL